MTVSILPLAMLLVVFPGIINNVRNDGGNIIVVGDGGGIICGSTVKDLFRDGGESVLI